MPATYPLTPERILDASLDYDVIISSPEISNEARRARNTTGNPKKRFTLLHDFISWSDKETLLNFFEARRGEWEAFTWTQPASPLGDGLSYTVRFDINTMLVRKPLGLESGRYTIEVKLVEVI